MSAYQTTGFALPEDGWFHIATPGEWPHKPTGLVQVLDDPAMQAIVDAFVEHAKQPNWPGVLIDFDHQSLDQDKPTVAAGWITTLEKRPTGIWAQIRWSDLGRKSIEGGRYRFISPVWRSTDCAKLDDVKIRPMKLMNCAVTNDPNIKGLFPLSNSASPCFAINPPPMPIATFAPTSTTPPVPPVPAIPLRNRGGDLLRSAILNRDLTDEQLKAIHAKGRGGGGGGGGRGGWGSRTGNSPASPASNYSGHPESGSYKPPPRHVRDHEARIQAHEDEIRKLDASRPPRPEPPPNYDLVDPKQAGIDAMKKPGATSTDVLKAQSDAKAENARRKSELDALKRRIDARYATPGARERALARELEKRQTDYDNDLSKWHQDNGRIDEEISKVRQKIDAENLRANETARRIEIEDGKAAEKARQKEIRERIEADKAAERERQKKEREAKVKIAEAEREARRQEGEYPREIRKRKNYYDAWRRGDDDYARRLYPDADHDETKRRVDMFKQANEGVNKTYADRLWREFVEREPPQRP